MPDPSPEEVVDSINDVSGVHPGHRAAHAKGTLCAGTFTATPAASRLTRAAHMNGDTLRATVRFSNGGGDPRIPDYATEGRGMAVKLYLEDGGRADMVALTLPVFFARTPEDFLAFTRARKPDPATGQPDMTRMGKWLGEHPEAGPAIQAAVTAPPPESYARCEYNGIHAFRYVNADGEARYIRFRWEPEDGVASLSAEEAKERGKDYLQKDILERLRKGPVAFNLVVTLAELGDPVDDPTEAWPPERETVVVGRLELTGPETEREREGDVLVFDPTRVVDGIELTEDPILRYRHRAYAVSVERRSGAVLTPAA
ncbi:MAG TPA: catalase family peroxidase [Solirubrobacterales bacterium]|nr:catalase family peroxidase [Solirubrobacterales bacterium]